MSNISKLCAWYEAHCVDDWHEDHGVIIDTLDNPGWSLRINIENTNLDGKDLDELKIDRTELNWIVVRKRGSTFEAFGGPTNLDEMIGVFLTWVET